MVQRSQREDAGPSNAAMCWAACWGCSCLYLCTLLKVCKRGDVESVQAKRGSHMLATRNDVCVCYLSSKPLPMPCAVFHTHHYDAATDASTGAAPAGTITMLPC